MSRRLSNDLEEGEICEDEEIPAKQSNAGEYSITVNIEEINSAVKCFQSSDHVNAGSLHSNCYLEIPCQSAMSPEASTDNQQESNVDVENEADDKSEDSNDCEVNEEYDEESCSDHRMLNKNESDDSNSMNFQDELVEYDSNIEDELDDDKNNSDFSDEIVCDEGIVAASEFYSKITPLNKDAANKININALVVEDRTQKNPVEEVPVDDSWIFQSLGGEPEKVDVVRDEKQWLHEESNSCAKQIAELEKKFAEEKENYVRNMYSLLVTARSQIAALKKENMKLETKLLGNCTMVCPRCKHQLSIKNNSLKPKYTKILKGRCAIEMLFDNLPKMEEWLAANHLDKNPDELPVVLELPRKPTLTSTNSLLAPKKSLLRDIRQNGGEVTLALSNDCRNTVSLRPVAGRKEMQPARAISNSNKNSTKMCNHVTVMQHEKERESSCIAYNSRGRREKRSREKRRSVPNRCLEQQRHRIITTYTPRERSFDRDKWQHFSSPTLRNSHQSRLNTKRNTAKSTMSSSHCKVTDRKHQSPALSDFENRFDYRTSSAECRRRSVK